MHCTAERVKGKRVQIPNTSHVEEGSQVCSPPLGHF